ncbi:L-glyceraldehyde 3-phosphate reductase [Phycisphaerae bacterium RAS1]|nr:L-glyceraldehyde 3-phosphate reductase [Phycisphaerae bacterium RAS1]
MNYRRLGKAGVKVSEIALGNWLTHGNGVGDDVARACIRKAYDLGVNFFDTADIYNRGAAEEVFGRELAAFRRQDIVLATKLFWPMSDNVNDKGLSRKHTFEALHNSLRRLKTDYIDLYQCHRHDPEVEMFEIVRTMDDLTRQGKILYWGVSEWPAIEIANACAIARQINAYPPVSSQPEYSYAARRIETNGVISACRQEGVGNVVWSPLKQGLLSGKYSGGKVPADSRAASDRMSGFLKEIDRRIVDRVDQLRGAAQRCGGTPAQLALAWLLRRETVSSVITGATRVPQVEENCAAIDMKLDDAVMKQIDELFPARDFQ